MENELDISDWDQRKLSRIERLQKHLDPKVTNEIANEEDLEYLEILRKVIHWQSRKMMTPADCRKALLNPVETNGKKYSVKQTYTIWEDANIIFGNVTEINQNVAKNVLYEQLMRANKLALDCGKGSNIEKATLISKNVKIAAEILGLNKITAHIDLEKIQPAINVNFIMQGENNNIQLIQNQQNNATGSTNE
jgi:hypothetical protein